jgi:hypothetical protein
MFQIGFAVLSFFTHFLSLIRGHKSVIEKRESISKKLDSIIQEGTFISMEELRDIQDEIYLTRKEAAKVPDWFSDFYKENLNNASERYIALINTKYN